MSIRDDFFAAKAKGSLWDVAVSIKRGNPLPLDADSIFESYAALETYAADVLAYPGQLVAVVEEDSTGIYYLDQNLAIQPVGVIPAGDNKSIDMGEGNIFALHDFGKAFYKYYPEEKNEQGEVTKEAYYSKVEVSEENPWKAGLEPKVTTEEGQLVIGWYEPNPTTIEGVNDQVTAVQGTVADLETSVGTPSTEDAPATGLYKEVEDVQEEVETLTNEVGTSEDALGENVNTIWANVNDHTARLEALEAEEAPVLGVAADDKILALGTDKLIKSTLSMSYDEENKAIKLYGKDNTELGSVDATPFIKDGMLHDVDYDPETNKLTFTWSTDAGEKTDEVILSDIIEPYTAGNGLELSGNSFGVKIHTDSEGFLSAEAGGLKLSGIQDAIDAAEGRAAEDAQSKADQALADAKSDAANLYATKAYVGAIPDNYTETNVISYINKKAEEVLSAAQGGSSETAASVKQQLDNYKSENDTKVNANTSAIEEINEKLATVEENANVNIIEVVKVNGTALTVTDKSVDVIVPGALSQLEGWTALDERVTTAKVQADKGVEEAGKAQATAANNAENIGKHETRIGLLETAKGDHEGRLLTLEGTSNTHAAEYTALKAVVDGHTGLIAEKATQVALNEVSARVTTNETAIKTLNETTVPGLLTEIGKKADASTVYTKTEIGTIAEGKTLVQMISDAQSAATYDDSEIRGLIAAEESRALAAEGIIEGKLATIETFFAAVETPDETIDTLAEIVKYIEDDKSGAASMLASIQSNTNAINAINSETDGLLVKAKAYTDEKISAIPVAGALLGLVKSSEEDNKVKVENDGTMSINRISVNKLYVEEGDEFILNGGTAN